MDYINHTENRYRIVYGSYEGIQKQAVNRLYGIVAGYVPYVLVASQAGDVNIEKSDDNIILVGTLENNEHISRLSRQGHIEAEINKEGYSIKVLDNPWNAHRTLMVLQGADSSGVLYSVYDFNRWYIQHKLQYEGYHYNKRYSPFTDKSLQFARKSAPKIEYRGLWSWGHVIYDYKGYIDNMSRCKLNCLVLWNDFVPINAQEIVEYAHMNGVRIIWGFTWCWGERDINPKSKKDLHKWTDYVLKTYETQYRGLDADGIYFQIFTETNDMTLDGEIIAELAANWVNEISSAVYKKYPDLWIQFGLHATSVKENFEKFSSIDPRMSIVWEDAGGFPYYYDPKNSDSFQKTYDYTKQLLSVRGENERFGAVFKGFTVLNWTLFEHQKGAYILGERESAFLHAHKLEKEFYWRYGAPYWLGQSNELAALIKLIAESPVKDRLITALVEDGLWECDTHISMALLAELLWDPWVDIDEIVKILCHSGYKI